MRVKVTIWQDEVVEVGYPSERAATTAEYHKQMEDGFHSGRVMSLLNLRMVSAIDGVGWMGWYGG